MEFKFCPWFLNYIQYSVNTKKRITCYIGRGDISQFLNIIENIQVLCINYNLNKPKKVSTYASIFFVAI